MMNMGDGVAAFELPKPVGYSWHRVVDTSLPPPNDIMASGAEVLIAGHSYLVNGHSVVLLASAPNV
jgi:glycogen operon protein